MLGHTTWSVRVADRDPQRLQAAETLWEKGLGNAPGPGLGSASGPGLGRITKAKSEGVVAVGVGKGKGKKDKESPRRTWGVLPSALCDHLPAHSLVSAHVQVIDTPCRNNLSTHTVDTPYLHTLSTHTILNLRYLIPNPTYHNSFLFYPKLS